MQVTKLYAELLKARAAVFGLHRAGFEGHLIALDGVFGPRDTRIGLSKMATYRELCCAELGCVSGQVFEY